MESVTILIDVQNIYYTTKQSYQRNFDYNRFWAEVSENREVVKAIAYAIDRGDEKQKQFQNILKAIGFEVKLKPYIQRKDGSAKGDWDVGITIDALEHAKNTDAIVLLSGDGDFDLLARKVIDDLNKKFIVYGVPNLTASALINSATAFIPIDEKLLLP